MCITYVKAQLAQCVTEMINRFFFYNESDIIIPEEIMHSRVFFEQWYDGAAQSYSTIARYRRCKKNSYGNSLDKL